MDKQTVACQMNDLSPCPPRLDIGMSSYGNVGGPRRKAARAGAALDRRAAPAPQGFASHAGLANQSALPGGGPDQ